MKEDKDYLNYFTFAQTKRTKKDSYNAELLLSNLLSPWEFVHVSKPVTLYLLKWDNSASSSSLFILDECKVIKPKGPS